MRHTWQYVHANPSIILINFLNDQKERSEIQTRPNATSVRSETACNKALYSCNASFLPLQQSPTRSEGKNSHEASATYRVRSKREGMKVRSNEKYNEWKQPRNTQSMDLQACLIIQTYQHGRQCIAYLSVSWKLAVTTHT
jgi:hypothetical protein